MTDLNSVIIEGEVTARIEGELTVAVTRTYKGADGRPCNEVSYFNVVADERTAKYFDKLIADCKRGDRIRVVGRLACKKCFTSRLTWYSKVFVVAEHIGELR